MSTYSNSLALVSAIAPITSSAVNDVEKQVTQLNQRIDNLNNKLSQLSVPDASGEGSQSDVQLQDQRQIIQAQLLALQSQVAMLQHGQSATTTDSRAAETQGAIVAPSENKRLDLYV